MSIPQVLDVQRIYTDDNGVSRMEVIQWALSTEFSDVASLPLEVASEIAVSQLGVIKAPPGWQGEWHTTPFRQLFFYLSGHARRELSDGSVHEMGPGTITLLDDTTGKGHRSWVTGDDDLILVHVRIEDGSTPFL